MEKERIIEHQFINKDFFFPNWEIETLVLGTFNPSCGEKTDYFYGRCRNNFWRTLEEISNMDYMFLQNNFEGKITLMSQEQFGCTDIIKSILITNNEYVGEICGSGYTDQAIFNRKKCSVAYQFEEIKDYIIEHQVKKVINTWGKRNNPKDFKRQLDELDSFCKRNRVSFIRECPSPSGRLRGTTNKAQLFSFYKNHLFRTK